MRKLSLPVQYASLPRPRENRLANMGMNNTKQVHQLSLCTLTSWERCHCLILSRRNGSHVPLQMDACTHWWSRMNSPMSSGYFCCGTGTRPLTTLRISLNTFTTKLVDASSVFNPTE